MKNSTASDEKMPESTSRHHIIPDNRMKAKRKCHKFHVRHSDDVCFWIFHFEFGISSSRAFAVASAYTKRAPARCEISQCQRKKERIWRALIRNDVVAATSAMFRSHDMNRWNEILSCMRTRRRNSRRRRGFAIKKKTLTASQNKRLIYLMDGI